MSHVKVPFLSKSATRLAALVLVWLLILLHAPGTYAQSQDAADAPLSNQQLEQLVATIALHPDSLLTQILMASTYPLEVVQAARWSKENPKIAGDALEDAMEKQPWDPSVKSLTAFQQALQMMNDDLSWTQQLGDAFLAQQEDVLDAVQRLRMRADEAGNLKTTKEQKVEKQTVTVEGGSQETVIIVEPADPKVIYVPAYNPTVIYGGWPYPAYPPYYWYPPGYVARRAFWFGVGVVAGHALWGRYDWGRRSVRVNVNVYNSFNRSNITRPNWNHNPRHRRAVPYRGRDVANRYGKGTRDVRSREQFRGRAEAGRRDLAKRPGAGQRPGAGKRPGAGQRPSVGKRPGAGQRPKMAARPATPKSRPAQRPVQRRSPSRRPAAYQGVGRGQQVRRNSSRGKASRSASRSRSRPSSSRSRGGGGRSRGGGRRGGGGRRR